ncbi:MAG: sigma-70 family RNA polymerase sigma factor [Acidiphilium sp.]|nr:sigma-70 family RNA polymerase sigma factor [Acidiphilium sp.]MDD4935866.1 sigma-70 family RNA polymerase sigma factor [Acidiphilium sp.]
MAEADPASRFRGLLLPELGYLRRLGLALAGSRPAGDELVQESVLRALRYFESYKGENFRAWMAAIMRNTHRDRPRVVPVPVDDEVLRNIADKSPDPEQLVVTKSNATRLRGMVAALPEALREVLVLREFGDLSYAQIATTLGVPVGTVMSRLSRARDDLRTAWRAEDKGVAS